MFERIVRFVGLVAISGFFWLMVYGTVRSWRRERDSVWVFVLGALFLLYVMWTSIRFQ
jgi:hypothetical protein